MGRLKNVIESQQFSYELLHALFEEADKLRKNPKEFLHIFDGKILATLFYEPSTRTRLSFESAMMRGGGKVISTENAREFSSAIKGESMQDTMRVVSKYVDCIVMRHYEEGSAKIASEVSSVPVINAGDGKGQHPTQALLDMYTIYRELGRVDNFKIAMVGDLASGRTVRSLCYLLGKCKNIEIIFVSPENLRMKDDIKEHLIKHKIKFREEDSLENVLPLADIVYMTRIQKERISEKDYQKAKGKFVIDSGNLHLVRKDARIMHPLPHVEEINLPLKIEQNDSRIAYFRQSENGVYIRMALLKYLLI